MHEVWIDEGTTRMAVVNRDGGQRSGVEWALGSGCWERSRKQDSGTDASGHLSLFEVRCCRPRTVRRVCLVAAIPAGYNAKCSRNAIRSSSELCRAAIVTAAATSASSRTPVPALYKSASAIQSAVCSTSPALRSYESVHVDSATHRSAQCQHDSDTPGQSLDACGRRAP